jgi:hypothetical protein
VIYNQTKEKIMDWNAIWDRLIERNDAKAFLEAREKYLEVCGEGTDSSVEEMQEAQQEYSHRILFFIAQFLTRLCELRVRN